MNGLSEISKQSYLIDRMITLFRSNFSKFLSALGHVFPILYALGDIFKFLSKSQFFHLFALGPLKQSFLSTAECKKRCLVHFM